NPTRPVVVPVAPPALDILVAEHPGLAGAVRYRGSHLRVTVGLAGVIPVKAFAAGQIASEIIEIVDRRVPVKLVKMSVPVTPVRQRPVAIDADCIDCWRGP